MTTHFTDDLWRELEHGATILERRRRRRTYGVGAFVAVVALVALVVFPDRNDGAVDLATQPPPTAIESVSTADPYPLGPPTHQDDGAVVYDLQLSDGGRFRLSLPQDLAGEYTVTEQPASAPILLEEVSVRIAISFAYCEGRSDDRRPNALGSTVHVADDSVRVCRPDERIVMDIEIEDGPASLNGAEHFDLRPIAYGARYGSALTALLPEIASCGNCAPFGPMTYADDGVVVNSTGPNSVAAVALDTLEDRWTYRTGRPGTALYGGEGGVFVGVDGREFLELDPSTGEELWRLPLRETDHELGLSGHGDGIWLLRSSDTIPDADPDDHYPPTLRRIDLDNGEVLWSAGGYKGFDWQPSRPVVVGDLAVIAGIADEFPEGNGPAELGYVRAFDVDTGDVVWTTDLDMVARAFVADAVTVVDVDSGPALLVRTGDGVLLRLDPSDGTVMWETDAVQVVGIEGTEVTADGTLAIDARSPLGGVQIDPDTGEFLASADDSAGTGGEFECPITLPIGPAFVPPDAWPATPPDDPRTLYWYGTEELWTIVELGTPRQPMKSVWWSVNFPGGAVEERPEIRVVYERLDGEHEQIVYEAPGTNANTGRQGGWFMINGIEPTDPGCWLVTATYKGAQLRVVFEI